MDTTEEIVTAAMLGRIDSEEADRAIAVSLIVQHKMFCDLTGQLMDARTAWGVQLYKPYQWDTMTAFHPSFLENAEAAEAARTRMNENFGEEGVSWRWVSVADVWEKIHG